jgi:hypothetical protein
MDIRSWNINDLTRAAKTLEELQHLMRILGLSTYEAQLRDARSAAETGANKLAEAAEALNIKL